MDFTMIASAIKTVFGFVPSTEKDVEMQGILVLPVPDTDWEEVVDLNALRAGLKKVVVQK